MCVCVYVCVCVCMYVRACIKRMHNFGNTTIEKMVCFGKSVFSYTDDTSKEYLLDVVKRIYGENSYDHIENKKQIIAKWTYGGSHMSRILPPKPDTSYFHPDIKVDDSLQKTMDDWIRRLNAQKIKGYEIGLSMKMEPLINPFVLEKAIASSSLVVSMLYIKELNRFLCATSDNVLIGFDATSREWSNFNAIIGFDLEDGFCVYSSYTPKVFQKEISDWKERHFVGTLFERYIGHVENKWFYY